LAETYGYVGWHCGLAHVHGPTLGPFLFFRFCSFSRYRTTYSVAVD